MIDQNTQERIDMGNMPRQRRKREKKLMSMDEVNERFPLTKYKIWRAGREENGLPTAGGIATTASRAPSIREHNELKRTSVEAPRNGQEENPSRTSDDHLHPRPESSVDHSKDDEPASPSATKTSYEKSRRGTFEETRQNNVEMLPPITKVSSPTEEEDDPIQTAAIPEELANSPGDQCAICIETLEDDDEVRGLSCGHAFHAGCLDPWLTSRRACCPLCKADYYVPKTRGDAARGANETNLNADLPQPPEQAHRPQFNLGGTNFVLDHHDRYGFPVLVRGDRTARPSRRQRRAANTEQEQPSDEQQTAQARGGFLRSLPSRFPTPRLPRFGRRRDRPPEGGSGTNATPGQLEAGTT